MAAPCTCISMATIMRSRVGHQRVYARFRRVIGAHAVNSTQAPSVRKRAVPTHSRVRVGGRFATLRDAIAGGALDEIRKFAQGAKPDLQLAGLKFLPTIPNPEKIMCVGINYKSHAAEHGADAPKLPNIFLRFVNTLVPH